MGVLLLVIDVALVALVEVMTWLGLTGKFGQGNISADLIPLPNIFRPTMSPTLRLVIRPYLSLQKCLTPTPLIQLAAENVKDGDLFGDSVSVFTDRAIVGAPNSNKKGKAYLYKRVLGA